MFVSRLSVNEFVLAPELTNLGAVSGSLIYRKQQDEYPDRSQEMKGLTRKQTLVIQTAHNRIKDKVEKLGGSGVIGVQTIHREIAEDIWEHTVQGTAIRGYGTGLDDNPFTCTLTGQEYFLLTNAGYKPIGIALGVSVYYQKFHERVQQKIDGGGGKSIFGQNVERSDFTRGVYTARRNALTDLEASAAAICASGVVGINITTKRVLNRQGRTSQGMLIELTALGTAIITSPNSTPSVGYCMPLAD